MSPGSPVATMVVSYTVQPEKEYLTTLTADQRRELDALLTKALIGVITLPYRAKWMSIPIASDQPSKAQAVQTVVDQITRADAAGNRVPIFTVQRGGDTYGVEIDGGGEIIIKYTYIGPDEHRKEIIFVGVLAGEGENAAKMPWTESFVVAGVTFTATISFVVSIGEPLDRSALTAEERLQILEHHALLQRERNRRSATFH